MEKLKHQQCRWKIQLLVPLIMMRKIGESMAVIDGLIILQMRIMILEQEGYMYYPNSVEAYKCAYDLGINLIAFGSPGMEDIKEIPQITYDYDFNSRPYDKTVVGGRSSTGFVIRTGSFNSLCEKRQN